MQPTETGDLLACDADVIVQQCNCVTVKSHGLSAAVFARYPYANVYAQRARRTRNAATSPAIPGTCVLRGPPRTLDGTVAGPLVANLLAQFYPGRAGNGWRTRGTAYRYAGYATLDDSPVARLAWFRAALVALAAQLATRAPPAVRTVALPYGIGCGLAGGDWPAYHAALEEWATQNPHLAVRLVQLPRT